MRIRKFVIIIILTVIYELTNILKIIREQFRPWVGQTYPSETAPFIEREKVRWTIYLYLIIKINLSVTLGIFLKKSFVNRDI